MLEVRLLSVEKEIWKGFAELVSVQTLSGDIGIMNGHIPLFAAMPPSGVVAINSEDGERKVAAVTEGFVSVTGTAVTILTILGESIEWIDSGTSLPDLDSLDPESYEYVQAKAITKALAKLENKQ